MMQDITEQGRIKRLITYGKLFPIELPIRDDSFCAGRDINPNDRGTEQCAQVMCDIAVAAADIEDPRSCGNRARNFERHIVSPSNFTAAEFAIPATRNAMCKSFPGS